MHVLSRDFKEVHHFEDTYQDEGLRFAPIPMDISMGKWLFYNSAGGSFSRLYSTKIEFYSKKKSMLSQPLGDFGVTYALHL